VHVVAALLALLGLACSSREGPPAGEDAGERDSGTTAMDTGPITRDSGPIDRDATSDVDSGPMSMDSGPMSRDSGPTPPDTGPARPDTGDCACPNSGTCMEPGEILCAPAPDYPCMWADGWYAECTRRGWECRFTTPAIC
jgi:hypothetical protein